jgi:hypothetical protein
MVLERLGRGDRRRFRLRDVTLRPAGAVADHALRDEAELLASTTARNLEIAVLERRGHAVDFLTRNTVSSRNGPPR